MATVANPNPGMFSNVMDIFRGAPVNPQQTGAPNNPNTPNTAPNGVVPPNTNPQDANANQQNTPAPDNKPPTTPLDPFKTLWDPIKDEGTGPVDFGAVDPKKMMEAAQKVDFAQILTPDIQATIAKGGEEGVRATIQAMNQMSQLVYGQSAMAATKIVSEAVKQARSEVSSQIPTLVKAAMVSSGLAKANPVFENPAVKPIVDGLKSQLVQKFPNATSDQIQEMAQNYFLGVSEMMKGKSSDSLQNSDTTPKKVKNMTGRGNEDWSEFFAQ